ncbi:glutathione S-transferase C-terminal domain-containing protein [Actinomycetaceae bacterium TAE3-ERU4]|nr:glutathione S-transferase C-terminal domain-containing protein [Actinomycetaceae bacterium TAE3-ERU4]
MSIPSLRFGVNAPEGTEALPVVAGRYRLVTYVGCPWCRRVLIARRLLGLESAIASSVASGSGDDGFVFADCEHGYDPDLLVRTTRELYRRQPLWEPGDSTSVPVLVDEENGSRQARIVCRESGDLLFDLATVWAPLHSERAPSLYPKDDAELLAELAEYEPWLDTNLGGAYGRLVHAPSPEDEQSAQTEVLATVTALEARLQGSTWLCGERLTTADVRAFSHLVALASYAGRKIYRAGRDAALAQGISEEAAKNAGTLALQEAASPFADWPALDAYYQRLAADPRWLTEDERRALRLP